MGFRVSAAVPGIGASSPRSTPRPNPPDAGPAGAATGAWRVSQGGGWYGPDCAAGCDSQGGGWYAFGDGRAPPSYPAAAGACIGER